MIEIFDRLEILNADLQKTELSVLDSMKKIEVVAYGLNMARETKFDKIWGKSIEDVVKLSIEGPKLPRQRRIPKRLQSGNVENHIFENPVQYYRKMYFQIFDQVVQSLNSRFDTDSSRFFKSLESFAIGQLSDVEKIIEFYQDDFDRERLINDRDLFLDVAKKSNGKMEKLKDVVGFLRINKEWCMGLVPEYVRYIRLLITIPGSSCTNERSFSVLRRMKNYLRSTMLQDRLNHVALLHIYSEIVDNLDIEQLMNEFIAKKHERASVFALSKM